MGGVAIARVPYVRYLRRWRAAEIILTVVIMVVLQRQYCKCFDVVGPVSVAPPGVLFQPLTWEIVMTEYGDYPKEQLQLTVCQR